MKFLEIQNLEDIGKLSLEQPYSFTPGQLAAIDASHQRLLSALKRQTRVYGVHTHFGFNVKNENTSNFSDHQRQLLDYLCVGTGPDFKPQVVRRALRLQAYKLSQGQSGVHPQTAVDLIELSNERDLPGVPFFGSLGASGDLIPMAHAVKPIFDRHPPRGPRDVIGLVNTNAMMAAYAMETIQKLDVILKLCSRSVAQILFATNASTDPLETELYSSRSLHPKTRSYLASIKDGVLQLRKRGAQLPFQQVNSGLVQHKYSYRVFPMVIDTVFKQLEFAKGLLLEECLAVADNPVITKDERFIHGGLFYTSHLATVADQITDSCSKLCDLIDRQILVLMDSQLTDGLPDNLFCAEEGLHAKGLHQLASSHLQRLRGLAVSSRNMTFSCESNNQDIVPGSMTSLHQSSQAVQILSDALKVHHFCSERATCLRIHSKVDALWQIRSWSLFEAQDLQKLFNNVPALSWHTNKGEKDEFCST